MSQWEKPAKAYHLRYLARRAVTLRDKKQATRLFYQMITTYWPILIEEPFRTALTGCATATLWILPMPIYKTLFDVAAKFTGKSQMRRIESSASSLN